MAAWLAGLVALVLVSPAWAGPPKPGPSQHGSYAKPDGETFFALSLEIVLDEPANRDIDVVVLFDTSASQTAIYRDKGLAVLEALLEDLNPNDRVHLLAVDIEAVPMTDTFTGPQTAEMKKAVAKLKRRTPLGATDMVLALEAAAKSYTPNPKSPGKNGRAVLYLGDGMSAANLISFETLEKLVASLVELRAPVTGFAIGPRLDNELLGAIANHTGGMRLTDSPDRPAKNFGRDLANAAHGSVFWPTAIKVPPQMVEVLPKKPTPLRNDRDSILIGRGKFADPFEVTLTIDDGGKPHKLTWTVEPKKPEEDYSFLADLIVRGRHHDGIGLPTTGKNSLLEIRNFLDNNVRKLIQLARTAIATENPDQAEQLAKKALETDPNNPEAKAVLSAVEKLREKAGAKAGAKTGDTGKIKLGPAVKPEPKTETVKPKLEVKPKPEKETAPK